MYTQNRFQLYCMSPACGNARGGLVAGRDLVVTEIEPGSACAGIIQESPETVRRLRGEMRL